MNFILENLINDQILLSMIYFWTFDFYQILGYLKFSDELYRYYDIIVILFWHYTPLHYS
jgi:hypothetical protein